MARINSQILFMTTSPRTPEKMIPEIGLLIEHFAGQKWNKVVQCAFMEVLREEQFFNGKGKNDPALSARDRITRAPKSLGFVTLSPTISLTPAGCSLLHSKRKEEVFLRQMLKFQIPSPYHKPTAKATVFCVKPYLEILRLVRKLGTLKLDELQIFGMQLTDWHYFDCIVHKIEEFRIEKAQHKGSYRNFKAEYLDNELKRIYKERITHGELKTRESRDKSLTKFLKTQSSNMRDYADACFRYLHATGLVAISHVGKSLSIIPERVADVDYILENVGRNPVFVDDNASYIDYLGNAEFPKLLTDNREMLIQKLQDEFPQIPLASSASLEHLKEMLADLIEQRKIDTITTKIAEIKDYHLYAEIQETFEQITSKKIYDAPLILEWNTWRAMTMLDGGDIRANLKFDDYGQPLSTAAGNLSDIVCDYGDYMVCVEVTMASGQRQYEMEGEPVSRHLGKIKKESRKPCYCLFIAPTINKACIAHFYILHKYDVEMYGGRSRIIPLPLNIFRKMIEDSYKANYTPNPTNVRQFFETSIELANSCNNEQVWYEQLIQKALHWLE